MWYTLPKTNSSLHLKIGKIPQRKRKSIPKGIHFQVRKAVSFREGKHFWKILKNEKKPPPWTGETARRWIFEISCGSGGFDVGVVKDVKRFLVPGCQLLGVFKVFRKSACFFVCVFFLISKFDESEIKFEMEIYSWLWGCVNLHGLPTE